MAEKTLTFKQFRTVDYKPGASDEENHRAYKRKRNTNLNGVEEEQEIDEILTLQGRRKLARATKRRKTRLKLARKKAMKRLATQKVLKKRSRRGARAEFANKLAGKGKKKSDLSNAKKKAIEKRLSQGGWQQRIAILTRRMMPVKRRQEIQRKNR